MSDSDSDYEEVEHLVFADFNNQLMLQQLADPNAAIKFIGFDSQNPMAEINGIIFKGTYDLSMGTNVFFEPDEANVPGDPLFESTCKQKFKYFNKSDKILQFQRVYVEPKAQQHSDASAMDVVKEEPSDVPTVKTESSVKLNISYKNAIKKFCNEE